MVDFIRVVSDVSSASILFNCREERIGELAGAGGACVIGD